MTTKTVTTCDVYGTLKGVKVYEILVSDDEGKAVWSRTCDLSPRALERLKAGLERMTTASKKRKA